MKIIKPVLLGPKLIAVGPLKCFKMLQDIIFYENLNVFDLDLNIHDFNILLKQIKCL